jgi:hypothetical protein
MYACDTENWVCVCAQMELCESEASRRNICDAFATPSGIKREWYVCMWHRKLGVCVRPNGLVWIGGISEEYLWCFCYPFGHKAWVLSMYVIPKCVCVCVQVQLCESNFTFRSCSSEDSTKPRSQLKVVKLKWKNFLAPSNIHTYTDRAL